ncbi:ASCH domain-containing protein [Betaproteobacteria bacterium SCN2]|jgi:ASC-1-like (ASCH) protein|nr:ASCH domain-containing protein [Betaproteobacteria bacterium SCN2]
MNSENIPFIVPTRGLVIMEEPLNKILQGRKTMELRSKHNRQLGPVALIKNGSGKIFAVAEIVESVGPMTYEEFQARAHEHAVEPERQRDVFFEKGWTHGWRLKNVIRLSSPVNYTHNPGAVTYVNLDADAIKELNRQLATSA